ncbi:MAG: hypothetical protein RLZZ15_2898, partial [Verrucomicrobiota bacterium]
STSASSLPPFRHRLYGLTVATWTSFPELEPAAPDAPVDAVIRIGDVAEQLADARVTTRAYDAAPGRLLVRVRGTARFLATTGREILVQPTAGADEAAVRMYLLCSPVAGLLHQRGVLPLHASVVATPRGAVAFAGRSGSGKSTLAAFLQGRGFSVVADDVAAITFDAAGRHAVVAPGPREFKLAPDALAALGVAPEHTRQLGAGLTKRGVPITRGAGEAALPLVRIYVLAAAHGAHGPHGADGAPGAGEFAFEALAGAERCGWLIQDTYRVQYLPGLGVQHAHLRAVARVAEHVPLVRVRRPAGREFHLEELADRVLADLAR